MDVRSIHLATRLLCLSSGRCKLPSMLASGGVASPMNVAILRLSLADGAIEHLCRILKIKRRETRAMVVDERESCGKGGGTGINRPLGNLHSTFLRAGHPP